MQASEPARPPTLATTPAVVHVPAPAPAPSQVRRPKKKSTPAAQPRVNAWGAPPKANVQQLQKVQQQEATARQQEEKARSQQQQQQRAATQRAAAAPAPVWGKSEAPKKSLADIRKEQVAEEKLAAKKAKENARKGQLENQTVRQKGVWGATQKKTKSLAEIQKEEMMISKSSRPGGKPAPQKTTWASHASGGVVSSSSPWSKSPGNKWPTPGTSRPTRNPSQTTPTQEAIDKTSWPSMSERSTTNRSGTTQSAAWPAAPKPAKQASRQRQPATQKPAEKPKMAGVWGSSSGPKKSLAQIQAEEQAGKSDWPVHSNDLAAMSANLKGMLGVGRSGGRSGGSGTAWGASGGNAPRSLSLEEIQAEEARQRATQRASGGSSRSGAWSSKVTGSKATVPRSKAFPDNRPVETGPTEDELLWGDAGLSSINTSNVQPEPRPDREAHQIRSVSRPAPSGGNSFGGPKMNPQFRKWCQSSLAKLNGSEDTTLVEYCLTLSNPSEIRAAFSENLGSTPEISQFATEFLKRKQAQNGGSGAKAGKFAGSNSGRRHRRPRKGNRT